MSAEPGPRTVNVSLGQRSHRIQIGSGLLARLGKACARLELGRSCAIISDTNVAAHHAEAPPVREPRNTRNTRKREEL